MKDTLLCTELITMLREHVNRYGSGSQVFVQVGDASEEEDRIYGVFPEGVCEVGDPGPTDFVLQATEEEFHAVIAPLPKR